MQLFIFGKMVVKLITLLINNLIEMVLQQNVYTYKHY